VGLTFSRRVPADLSPNRVAAALESLRQAGVPVVDLTESNPTRVGLDYPEHILQPLADPCARFYEPRPFGLPAAREAVAADFRRRHFDVSPDRIVLTASTSEAYSVLFKLLCDPGDNVLVPHPSYPLFEHLTGLDGVMAEPYTLDYHGLWTIDRDSLERVITPRTRAILVVNPNNPTGSCLTPGDLAVVDEVADRHGLALIGDEVFADYPLDRAEWVSVLQGTRALTFALGGLSKSAGLPQVKLGWMALDGPDALVQAALARLEIICDTYLSVATPVQHAAGALIAAGAAIRGQILDRVRTNLGYLRAATRGWPSCRVLEAQAGWCAVIQVPATRSEESLVLELLDHQRVLVHPGYFFDFPREAFLIVSLLPPPDEFADAIARVLKHASA
jgi:aspartate/methionine/tyrosine aminotransferase